MCLPNYPLINEFMSNLPNISDTFLYNNLTKGKYGFWPHFEYFLANLQRLNNHESILRKLSITASLKMNNCMAWKEWRKFRSAQHEITSIFLIEQCFLGNVLEIIPESNNPTPDLKVKLGSLELLVEIKSQSGQQHGDKHPMEKGTIGFDPKDESDLKSWLFEKRISSRNNRPMTPKTMEADHQGADILIALTDIFPMKYDIYSKVSSLCPNSRLIETRKYQMQRAKLGEIYFFQAEFPFLNLNKLQEIWLFDDSHLDKFIVLSKSMFLLDHLRTQHNLITA